MLTYVLFLDKLRALKRESFNNNNNNNNDNDNNNNNNNNNNFIYVSKLI